MFFPPQSQYPTKLHLIKQSLNADLIKPKNAQRSSKQTLHNISARKSTKNISASKYHRSAKVIPLEEEKTRCFPPFRGEKSSPMLILFLISELPISVLRTYLMKSTELVLNAA